MMTAELTPLQRVLLDALRGKGWMSRKDIAAALGRNAINPNDVAKLEALVSCGLVEKKKEAAMPGAIVLARFMYRLPQS